MGDGTYLELVEEFFRPHSLGALKRAFFLLFGAGLGLVMCSCQAVDDHRAGGGAFEHGYLGRTLDSNNPNLEDTHDEKGKTAPLSHSRWRHERED